jgi:hypothetical protein
MLPAIDGKKEDSTWPFSLEAGLYEVGLGENDTSMDTLTTL